MPSLTHSRYFFTGFDTFPCLPPIKAQYYKMIIEPHWFKTSVFPLGSFLLSLEYFAQKCLVRGFWGLSKIWAGSFFHQYPSSIKNTDVPLLWQIPFHGSLQSWSFFQGQIFITSSTSPTISGSSEEVGRQEHNFRLHGQGPCYGNSLFLPPDSWDGYTWSLSLTLLSSTNR